MAINVDKSQQWFIAGPSKQMDFLGKKEIGSENRDRPDENSRLPLSMVTHSTTLPPVCVASEQQTCISPAPVSGQSVAFHLPAWRYTCFNRRGSRYIGEGHLRGIFIASKNAAAPPSSSHCHCLWRASTSSLWRGFLAKSWSVVRFHIDSNLQAIDNYFATSTPSLLAALLGFPKEEKVSQDRIGNELQEHQRIWLLNIVGLEIISYP